MKKGFTLIELLAVIVILAIVALIATPIILGIINDAKKESAKISAQNYFDAVELAISREYVKDPNKDLDGIYATIANGNKIKSENKELTIEYSGQGLEEGAILTIESGKVIEVENAKINKWAVTIEEGKIVLEEIKTNNISATTNLIAGQEFNAKIKTLANGTDMFFFLKDEKVTSIQFFSNGSLPKDYTKETLQKLDNVDVSLKENGSVVAYYDNGSVYVYSDDIISFNENSNYMFNSFINITNIIFGNITTNNVQDMSYMFGNYSGDNALDLSNFNTSNVTNMSGMFSSYSSTASLDLSRIDTSSVTDMSYMFSNYSSAASLNLSNFNTSNVTNMNYMFSGYSSTASLDLSELNTSSVTDMSWMFSNYSSAASLNLSNFNTSNVTNMSYMFYGGSGLTSLDLSSFDTSKVTDMSYMFALIENPVTITVNKNIWITDNAYIHGMFEESQAQITYSE